MSSKDILTGEIRTGKNFKRSNTSRIFSHEGSKLIIGDNVYFAGEVVIMNHFHDLSMAGSIKNNLPSSLEIGDNVFIGYRAMVLPQVKRIGKNAIIGAGSVLVDDVSDNEIWAGNPARKIKMRI